MAETCGNKIMGSITNPTIPFIAWNENSKKKAQCNGGVPASHATKNEFSMYTERDGIMKMSEMAFLSPSARTGNFYTHEVLPRKPNWLSYPALHARIS